MRSILLAIAVLASACVPAGDGLVEKQEFVTEGFETFGGRTIPELRLGWEAYGELSEDRDNVILVTHYFSGTSHAAGRYRPDDPEPGYWDAIIGPGKAIDTERFYVISMDTPVNANVHDEHVITTGPASIHPETGKPWGTDFPVLTIRDFVETQRLLLDELGIERLHAVIGASMGALQAIEWAVAHPDRVERVIPVIGAHRMGPWEIALLESWARPIRLDPNWNGGDYYDGEPPIEGLTLSMALITQNALHPDFFEQTFADHDNVTERALGGIDGGFPVTDWLYQQARGRAESQDANHVLYLTRASQLFIAGHDNDLDRALQAVEAPMLLLPAAGDLLLRPELSHGLKRRLEALDKPVELAEIKGIMGHLDGVSAIQTQSERLKRFLD